jgi:hypothetical protein
VLCGYCPFGLGHGYWVLVYGYWLICILGFDLQSFKGLVALDIYEYGVYGNGG